MAKLTPELMNEVFQLLYTEKHFREGNEVDGRQIETMLKILVSE